MVLPHVISYNLICFPIRLMDSFHEPCLPSDVVSPDR